MKIPGPGEFVPVYSARTMAIVVFVVIATLDAELAPWIETEVLRRWPDVTPDEMGTVMQAVRDSLGSGRAMPSVAWTVPEGRA